MGYYMEQVDQSFFISKDNFTKVVNAIHALASNTADMGGASIKDGNTISHHYSWVNMDFVNTNDLKEIFKCWRWHVDFNDSGDIDSIYFEGQKLGDDEALFRAIAPFVKEMSYIEMRGEENHLWRWIFKSGQCREVYAQISWDY